MPKYQICYVYETRYYKVFEAETAEEAEELAEAEVCDAAFSSWDVDQTDPGEIYNHGEVKDE